MTQDPSRLREARRRLAAHVHETPLLTSATLSARVGAEVGLKAEHLQKTGSFKARGALNRILELDPAEREVGVVTISAGNHAAAVAWAAGRAGVPATVVMPESASTSKVEASRGYGAGVVLHGDVFQAFERCLELRDREGLTLVHPFDDAAVIEGQATVGLELLEQLPEATTFVVPVGGGGLISGIATALEATGSTARLWGVEPEGAAGMSKSLEAGSAQRLDRVETVADGLGAPMAGERTYPIVKRRVEGIVLVSDAEIVEAMAFLLERTKQLVEPAGAAGVAALLAGRVPVGSGPVAVVLSGGNVAPATLADLLAGRA